MGVTVTTGAARPSFATPLVTVFAVYKGSEVSEGRGPMHAVASTKERAKVLARGVGAWGGDGEIVERKAIEVAGVFYLLDGSAPMPLTLDEGFEDAQRRLREVALSKLTPEERQVLGL